MTARWRRTVETDSHKVGNEGFALIAVAIALAALSMMIATVVYASRQSIQDTSSRLVLLKLTTALDAGFATASRDLSQSGTSALPLLTQPQTVTLDRVTVTVSARPEAAKIDLNTADPALIAALFRAHGISQEMAARYSAELADWREKGAIARPHGAKAAEYLAAGRHYVPPNHGLEWISELALILHGNADLAACVAPDVTLYSGGAGIALESASPSVVEAARLAGVSHINQSVVAQTSVASGHSVEAGAIYELDFTTKDANSGVTASRQNIVRVTGNLREPIWILAQYPAIPDEHAAAAACARLSHLS
jgi:general secretion pathway protein K